MAKAFRLFAWGASSFNVDIIKDQKLTLPVKNGKIDYDFMESFIAELEAERIAELEAYLSAAGLKDYQLTPEEQQTLNDFEQGKVKWGEFKIGDLFYIQPTKNYGLSNADLLKTTGNIPVVSNTSTNNGITAHVDLMPTEKGNIITFSDTTTDDAIFYQPNDFVGYSHVQKMIKRFEDDVGKRELLFIVAMFKRAVRGKYSYGNKFNRDNASKEKIHLPVKNNQPNYSTMSTLTSAIQKLVIKDVVLYTQAKSEAYAQVIGH
jgi:hypothetical protein